MILFYIYIGLLGLCFVLQKSKIVTLVSAGYMWFITSFCTNPADITTYIRRYTMYTKIEEQTEYGFNVVVSTFNAMGVDYQTFMCIVYAFIIIVICWFILSNTTRPAMAFGLYAACTFTIDMVQMRNTLGFVMVLIGIHLLMNLKRKWLATLLYVVMVLLGTSFHAANIAFLLLLIPFYFDLIQNFVITAVALLVLPILTSSELLTRLSSLFVGQEKALQISRRINRFEEISAQRITFIVLVSAALVIFLLLVVKYNLRKPMFRTLEDYQAVAAPVRRVDMILNMQLIMLSVIPFISWTLDIYRNPRYMLMVGFVGVSQYMAGKNKKLLIGNWLFTGLCIVAVMMIFYLQIDTINNHVRAFEVFFTDNLFFPASV